MRGRGFFPMLAAVSLAGIGALASPAAVAPLLVAPSPVESRNRRRALAPSVPVRYRSRRYQAKPRRRSNRLHISRRVRRRHRRAR